MPATAQNVAAAPYSIALRGSHRATRIVSTTDATRNSQTEPLAALLLDCVLRCQPLAVVAPGTTLRAEQLRAARDVNEYEPR